MSAPTYFDFAILGDTQPEGLLVGTALVRKGFAVALVPSALLGELPSDELIPTQLPSQAGARKLDDLIFKAGFFRLEDSGLVAQTSRLQMVFPRHRLTLEGTWDQWMPELRREFPQSAEGFERALIRIKSAHMSRAAVRRGALEIMDLERADPMFSRWLKMQLQVTLNPSADTALENTSERKDLVAEWIQNLLYHSGKVYRIDSKLKTPYHQFLTEHARKWGVHVVTETPRFTRSWSSYELAPKVKVRHFILNSVGAGRGLAKSLGLPSPEKASAWLYLDRIECPVSALPEPLQEVCALEAGDKYEILHIRKDLLRDEAHLSFGTWLPFDESKDWLQKIQAGRSHLMKLIPFLKTDVFRQIPNLLELTEMRGECIRRGHTDRLRWAAPQTKRLSRLMRRIRGSASLPITDLKRVYSVSPMELPLRSRAKSFEMSLNLLDHFDRKNRKMR